MVNVPSKWVRYQFGDPWLVVQSTVSFNYPELIVNGVHQSSWQLSMSCCQSSFTQLSPDHFCHINSQSFLWREIYLWNRLLPSLDSLQERKRYYWTLYTLTPHILSLTKIILLESWKRLLSICNFCKTMKNVLGHTHVMILGLCQLHALGKGWVDMGVRGYYKRESIGIQDLQRSLSPTHSLHYYHHHHHHHHHLLASSS